MKKSTGNIIITRVPTIAVAQDQHIRADIYTSQNGTLRHSDINLVLSHRAEEKVDKHREGYGLLTAALLSSTLTRAGQVYRSFVQTPIG